MSTGPPWRVHSEHSDWRSKWPNEKTYLYSLHLPFQSQIKKEFFGALRIRKVQDAQDPTLATRRMATTVHVYDAVKTRMDEALRGA